jgi:PncC family amidohydrolase
MEFDKGLLQKIRDKLLRQNKTIATAESVTSGNVQVALSQAKDASLFFQGGITAYNLGQKYKHLAVEPIHALSCMCVSAKVAEEMAINVCQLFNSDYGVGITGFASTQPEKGVDALYAYIAIAEKEKIILSEKVDAPKKESHLVQAFYTEHLLRRLAALN